MVDVGTEAWLSTFLKVPPEPPLPPGPRLACCQPGPRRGRPAHLACLLPSRGRPQHQAGRVLPAPAEPQLRNGVTVPQKGVGGVNGESRKHLEKKPGAQEHGDLVHSKVAESPQRPWQLGVGVLGNSAPMTADSPGALPPCLRAPAHSRCLLGPLGPAHEFPGQPMSDKARLPKGTPRPPGGMEGRRL